MTYTITETLGKVRENFWKTLVSYLLFIFFLENFEIVTFGDAITRFYKIYVHYNEIKLQI